MVLHSLVSQSIFVISLIGFGPGPDPIRLPTYDKSSVGYSPLGISLSIALSASLVIALLANSLRHYPDVPSEFPAMGMSSAAIGLFCQRPDMDCDAHLFPVSLGVVGDGRAGNVEVKKLLVITTHINLKRPGNTNVQYLRPVVPSRDPRGFANAFIRLKSVLGIAMESLLE